MTDAFLPLFHYSATPLGELRSMVPQEPREGDSWTFIDKPRGLWVSVDDAWEEWCRENEFNVPSLAVKQRVVLKDFEGKLLLLSTPPEILEFQERYGLPHPRIPEHYGIDWARVALNYGGIIIAPYQWSLRLDLMWYYGWDCASGCIWDTSIIAGVEPPSDRGDEHG
jgi:hypothetical protein